MYAVRWLDAVRTLVGRQSAPQTTLPSWSCKLSLGNALARLGVSGILLPLERLRFRGVGLCCSRSSGLNTTGQSPPEAAAPVAMLRIPVLARAASARALRIDFRRGAPVGRGSEADRADGRQAGRHMRQAVLVPLRMARNTYMLGDGGRSSLLEIAGLARLPIKLALVENLSTAHARKCCCSCY